MAAIDYLELFDESIAAGGRVQSLPFDCATARTVQVTLATGPLSDAVEWRVLFGPVSNGGFAAARSGTFEHFHHLGIDVPVFGPQVMVDVENRGASPFLMLGMIRIVHEFE